MKALAHRIGAVFLLLAATVAAQTNASNWNTVKALAAGTDVRILNGSRTVSGKIDRITDDNLVMASGKGQEMFTQQEITRVSIRKKGHRLRNTLIGFGAGTGVGLGIGAASDAGCQGWFCGLDTAAGGLIGALGGTIAGALWPTGGWREIYKK
jgi:hypothetical protein